MNWGDTDRHAAWMSPPLSQESQSNPHMLQEHEACYSCLTFVTFNLRIHSLSVVHSDLETARGRDHMLPISVDATPSHHPAFGCKNLQLLMVSVSILFTDCLFSARLSQYLQLLKCLCDPRREWGAPGRPAPTMNEVEMTTLSPWALRPGIQKSMVGGLQAGKLWLARGHCASHLGWGMLVGDGRARSLSWSFLGGWGKCGARRSGHRGWASPASAREKRRHWRWPYVSSPPKLGHSLTCGLNPWKNRGIMGAGASLMIQWLRVCLAMQRILVPSWMWEDPTCHGATKPVGPRLPKHMCWEPVLPNKRSCHNEMPMHRN